MSNSYISLAKNYIRHHYFEGITVGEIADYVHISSKHLYKLFMIETGTSVKEYIIQERMKNAKMLLKNNLKIHAVAVAVGYSNEYTFSAAFKKYCGVSPSIYRRKILENHN